MKYAAGPLIGSTFMRLGATGRGTETGTGTANYQLATGNCQQPAVSRHWDFEDPSSSPRKLLR